VQAQLGVVVEQVGHHAWSAYRVGFRWQRPAMDVAND